MANINNCLTTDIAIIGGGIAGLMLQNKLNNLGYSSLLLEHHSLGHGQTAKSQGIIHGGIKYALLGQVTDAAKAICDMPCVWNKYLSNDASADYPLDLSKTKVLSKHHLLWNNGDLRNRLKQVLMQKTLSSTGHALPKFKYPTILQNNHFKGNVYQINETVLDVYSLLENLSRPHQNKIIKTDQNSLKVFLNNNREINNLTFHQNGQLYNIAASQYIFTSGENNQQIIDLLPKLPTMQLRPLHMVIAKLPEPHLLYGHYVGAGMMPLLTISTHFTKCNDTIWYIGGKIAETGIYLSSEQQILQAKVEINNIFPWLDTSNWLWATTMVNRAEPSQTHNMKPDDALTAQSKNAIVAWPTKLALTPVMVNNIINTIQNKKILPQQNQVDIKDYNLDTAKVTTPLWEKVFIEEVV